MNAVGTAIYNTLKNYSALTSTLGGTAIYFNVMPRDKSLPAVIISMAGGSERNETPRRSVDLVYSVKAIATTAYTAGQIAEQIDAALHDATLTVSGWGNYWTAREGVYQYLETDPAGHTFGHAGAQYRVRIAGS